MSFLTPSTLAFLALAALPPVLWLLLRRRRREVEWGAMYILRLTLASERRDKLWKQLVIVALRALVLALLVLAFARPLSAWRSLGDGLRFPHPPGTLHRVVLLDASASMLARHTAATRLDAARDVATALLASLRPGDTGTLLPLAPADPAQPLNLPPVRPGAGEAAARLLVDALPVTAEPVAFAPALRAALAAFRGAAAQRRELVLLTDLCRIDHLALADYRTFGDAFAQLGVEVVVLHAGADARPNLAVEGLSAGPELWLANQPTHLYAEVMNYGDAQSEDGHLQILVDGTLRAEEPCILPPGHRRSFAFTFALPGPGHRLEARLREDLLPADNALERFVRVAPALSILLVTADPPEREGFERDSAFLRRACESAAAGPAPLRLRTLAVEQLAPADLENADALVFCGVDRLPPGLAETLDRCLRRGTGLLLSTGPHIDPGRFNEQFHDWLPAPLDTPARDTVDPERYLTVQTADLPPGLLREFEGSDNGDLGAGRVYNHFRLADPAATGPAQPAADRLLLLANGDPLLLQRDLGRGRVLLWTTSLGGAWTSLPVHQAYLPLLCRLLNDLASRRAPPLSVLPGQPLLADVGAVAGPFYMTTPDSRLEPCPAVEAAGRRFARFTDTAAPGTYELRDADGKALAAFAVARPPHESDLRPLAGQPLEAFRSALGAVVVQSVDDLAAALRPAGAGIERTTWFLLAALLLLLADATLTRVWFR